MDFDIIEYKEEFGENPLTEEMKAELSGLSVDEQIDYFGLRVNGFEEKYSYGEGSGAQNRKYAKTLRSGIQEKVWFSPLVSGVIVSDGFIVGCIFNRNIPCLINQNKCTYFACDDDGTGSTDVSEYHGLVYVGKQN